MVYHVNFKILFAAPCKYVNDAKFRTKPLVKMDDT